MLAVLSSGDHNSSPKALQALLASLNGRAPSTMTPESFNGLLAPLSLNVSKRTSKK